MKFELTILGSNSATPTSTRFPSCQVLNVREKLFMVDCGEGAQIQLRRTKLRFSRLDHIFISHLHGDHVLGLPGLLASFSLLGREHPIHIYAHSDLEKMLDPVIRYFAHNISYDIHYHAINPNEHALIFEDKSIEVFSIPLNHKVPTCGFFFKEKDRERKMKKDLIDFYGLSVKDILALKKGEDYIKPDGEVIPNERLTEEPLPRPRSYAYISDTRFKPDIAPWLKGVDLLYHEATFATPEDLRSSKTYHSSAEQAANLATLAEAKKLLIGHFSARYKNSDLHEKNAKAIFPNTVAIADGMKFNV